MLQDSAERMIALRNARARMYADEVGESKVFEVADRGQDIEAVASGCRVADVPPDPLRPEYPKTMVKPGEPNGGATGLLIKDYRGKNAEQVIWKFDASLEGKFYDCLKQAAIEEGQWGQKVDTSDEAKQAMIVKKLHAGRQRVVDAKAKALADGKPWFEG
jgi:hypothetical protein